MHHFKNGFIIKSKIYCYSDLCCADTNAEIKQSKRDTNEEHMSLCRVVV